MNAKLFTLDKNFLLKEAQIQIKENLLVDLVKKVKKIYLTDYNPLGLIDKTIETIRRCHHPGIEFMERFYFEMAGVYRFKYGENQLEFIFDGSSHHDKYKKDWMKTFRRWTEDFCKYPHFIRTILEGSILSPGPELHSNLEIRLKLFLEQYFKLRVYKYHGIKKIRAA